jgi:hypothetical protein
VAADETTTVGGRIFADFTYIDQKSNDVKTDASGTGTDVKRAYLIVTHTFDDHWSANITTDFNYTSATNYAQIFIKKAYIQAKVSDAFIARLGSADLPWVPYVEDLYGYRYVEKLVVDRLSFGTTADWGLHGGGKAFDSKVNYAVSVINGNGYRNPTRAQTADVEARVGFVPIPGLNLAIGGYIGKRGQEKEGVSAAHTATRFDALVAFVNQQWRVGAEYFYASDWGPGPGLTTVASPPSAGTVIVGPASDKSDGYSLWAAWNFNPSWSVFVRGDEAKPSKDLHPGIRDRYYHGGFAWHARKNVDLALAVKHEKVDNGVMNTYNGAIGSTATGFNGQIGGSVDGTYTEAGLWAYLNF